MTPMRRTSRRWALGVPLFALGLWMLQVAPPPDADAPAPTSQPAADAVQAVVAMPTTAATHVLPAAPRSASPPTPAAAGQVEVCGFGAVTLAADDPYLLQYLPAPLHQRTLDALEARLRASADPAVRAAGLLIGAKAREDGRSRIEQLARLAMVSTDPRVYAMALEACQDSGAAGAASCSLLSRAQWVRLEPDNAQPWLELAAQARQQRDTEGESEAMRLAAQAQRSEALAGSFPALVDQGLGPQVPVLQRTLAMSVSWRLQSTWGSSHTSQAHAWCTADLDADSERRRVCEAVAETFAFRSRSVADLGIGVALGRHLGWPAARLQALQQEHDALSGGGGAPLVGIDFSCEAIERVQDWMRQVATRGERQATRDVLVRSGRSVEDWGAQYRRNVDLASLTVETAATGTGGQDPP
ncbi:MAG TPA: hypothetical protein VF169_18680 [Albitalea sp.]|uniref:hypothetical protein n=1 Tax=Piscinibacter sp. TaxID=1903157 RepID=UPI002ED5A6FF